MKNEPQQPQQPQQPQYQQPYIQPQQLYQQPPQYSYNWQGNAIRCPKCGSPIIDLVPEYHRGVGVRAAMTTLFLLCLIPLFFFLADFVPYILNDESMSDGSIFAGVIFGIMLATAVVLKISIYLTEVRTHIKGVCRTCGHIWFVD